MSFIAQGFEKELQRLSKLESAVQAKTLDKVIRAPLNVVKREAQRRAPDGSQTGTSDLKSAAKKNDVQLKDNLKTRVKYYDNAIVGIVGADYAKAPHAHLVEFGHEKFLWGRETGARVEGKEFLAPAVDSTRSEQDAAAEGSLARSLKAAGG